MIRNSKIFLFALSLIASSAVFGSESKVNDLIPTEQEEFESFSPTQFTHWNMRLGLMLYGQKIGMGFRTTDLESLRGNDLSLNVIHFGLPIHYAGSWVPNLQYARIFYHRNALENGARKYKGLGLGLTFYGLGKNSGIFFETGKHRLSRESLMATLPNVKFMWGKQYKKGNFSEWSFNILPVALVSYACYQIETKPRYRGDIHFKGMGYTGLAAAALCAFEYQYGF